MDVEIPLFPLNIVAYPGELVNLHIFEPRYKDLVRDCLENDQHFGIPTYNGKSMSHGTEMVIIKVEKTYPDGRMDIRTRGLRVFEIKDFYDPWRDHSYAGGRVEILKNKMENSPETAEKVLKLAKELFQWLNMNEKFKIDPENVSYSIAHKIGFKLDEELAILKTLNEQDRQMLIISHLERLLPALERAEQARERIMMNGHFRHLVPPDF
ncbi:MAG: LON peptidase substrate-binding domain-containing protein [Bacteroidota bacterium]